ncbi:MAG: hypothetical protein ACREX8_05265, partial [Gammaproteobacteria bacterium]
ASLLRRFAGQLTRNVPAPDGAAHPPDQSAPVISAPPDLSDTDAPQTIMSSEPAQAPAASPAHL